MHIVIIALIASMYVIDLVLNILNVKHSRLELPDNVKNIYDEEVYKKWASYNQEHLRFGIIQKSVFTALILGLLLFKVFGIFESIALNVTHSEILQTWIFLVIYLAIQTFIGIPFEYIDTFKIEEKYGFNKTTKKTFVIDQIKSFLLASLLFGALVAGLQGLYLAFIDSIWVFVLLAWVFLAVVMIIMFLLNTKVFVKLFNKLTPLEDGSLKEKIDKLANELGFEVEKISVMDASKRSSKLNAFFSGLGKTRDVVLYDTLIEKLSEEQVLAVLAHELGHATYKDTTKMLFQNILTFGLYALVIGLIMQSPSVYTAFGLEGVFFGFGLILFTILMGPISILLGMLTNGWSRKIEYRADGFAKKYVGQEHMIGALEVLARENFSNLNPHPLYVKLFYNHPTISERISSLEKKVI
ncbi:M48 family metallopeptidase [Mariniplasma anaerobium]|uniref:Peptidase M48 n=1 Tax=Mariniplasma anaerobium TaxID=2735436 RepID=A0A7U9THV6_9MOLU|nr:M48 family metallopeptidase [Mariniplasma anaerobium]BCR36770.1 peptidase M48 [Mariniplasma anaerobium]